MADYVLDKSKIPYYPMEIPVIYKDHIMLKFVEMFRKKFPVIFTKRGIDDKISFK